MERAEGFYIKGIRFYQKLYQKGRKRAANVMAFGNRICFMADIPAALDPGRGLRLPHFGLGVSIHPAARIGENCTIYQNVSICCGEGQKAPEIGDHVLIGSGAMIAGGVRIGNNCSIGANCIVDCDVPDNATAVGVPCRIIVPK